MVSKQAKIILTTFERSVRDLAESFQGKAAFNFSHELELVTSLFMQMRNHDVCATDEHGIPVHRTRIEWPCIVDRNIDLVIWKPGTEKKARRRWGTQRGRLAKVIPLLAAIQVKRGGGAVTSLELTKKDLVDLENVYESKDLGYPLLYFIEYADEDLREKDGDYTTYMAARQYLAQWCAKAPGCRRAFLISRDGIGFALPKERWLVDPLPKNTTETR